jgi:pimeloyl-ACP methyl ester carboxylesterase
VRNMSFATNGAARLADVAQGEGTPVLLMHAGVTDKRSWGPLIEALGDRCRTIAYDQRGYGETTYQPEAHSAVGDALAVLDAQGHGRCLAAIRELVLDVA